MPHHCASRVANLFLTFPTVPNSQYLLFRQLCQCAGLPLGAVVDHSLGFLRGHLVGVRELERE